MTWAISGTYLENCNCNAVCPCTWGSGPADTEHCYFLLAFRIDHGAVDGVDVSGLTFAVLGETPKLMTDGNWRWGVLIDAAASEEQSARLQGVATGTLGGPMAAFAPLVRDLLGVQRVPISFEVAAGVARARFGDLIDVELAPVRGIDGKDVTLGNVGHPANSTLTIAPATRSHVSAFGITYGAPGTSGFTAPFSWSA
jgi:hypothetical protein